MPAFPKPDFQYIFNLEKEIENLKVYRKKPSRLIPKKSNNQLLIATWNIANLGLQKRGPEHYKLLAEIISWFDFVAVQEVNDNLEGIYHLKKSLSASYNIIFSDKAGNNERLCYVYNSHKLKLLELVGEIAIPPNQAKNIKLNGVDQPFKGFDRNPYLCTFSWKGIVLAFINVHSIFGSENTADIERRSLEAYAISRYTDLEGKSKNAFTKNYICLGDFNIEKTEPGNPVYEALKSRGLTLPEHSTKIYSNINNDKQYDQIAFLPNIKRMTASSGVFDFDGAVFPDLWQESPAKFKAYLKYYLSDHRPMWLALKP